MTTKLILAGVMTLALTASVHAQTPLNSNDAQAVAKALLPLSKSEKSYDVSVTTWGDGSVSISLELKSGQKVRSSGSSLPAALTNLRYELNATQDAATKAGAGVAKLLPPSQ